MPFLKTLQTVCVHCGYLLRNPTQRIKKRILNKNALRVRFSSSWGSRKVKVAFSFSFLFRVKKSQEASLVFMSSVFETQLNIAELTRALMGSYLTCTDSFLFTVLPLHTHCSKALSFTGMVCQGLQCLTTRNILTKRNTNCSLGWKEKNFCLPMRKWHEIAGLWKRIRLPVYLLFCTLVASKSEQRMWLWSRQAVHSLCVMRWECLEFPGYKPSAFLGNLGFLSKAPFKCH